MIGPKEQDFCKGSPCTTHTHTHTLTAEKKTKKFTIFLPFRRGSFFYLAKKRNFRRRLAS